MNIINAISANQPIYVFYNYMDTLIAIIIFTASIMYRPMILGNNYSLIGIGLFVTSIILSVIKNKWKLSDLRKNHFRRNHSSTYFSAMVLYLYCAFQCVALSDQIQAGVQTILLLVVSTTAYYIVFKNKAVLVLFIRMLYLVMALFSCSYVVSFILMLFRGWNAIQIASIDYGYFTEANIYFPFTITYGEMPFSGLLLKRLLGFTRESGIMQIFYVWGYFSAKKYFQKTRLIQVIMVIGILACLSTAGYVVFGISLLLYYDVRQLLKKSGFKRTLIIFLLIAAVIYFLFFASGTRIADRAIKTITDRTTGIEYGLRAFVGKPLFGGGFFSTLGAGNVQVGVCAISSLGQVGLVGFILWLSVYGFTYLFSKNKKSFIYSNAAHFITALFSQPIMFAPVMYWFFFSDYSNKRFILEKRNKRTVRVEIYANNIGN